MNAAVLNPSANETAGPPDQGPEAGFSWQAGFSALGPAFYTHLNPEPLPEPYWVGRSQQAAQQLGLIPAQMDSDALLQALTGNTLLPGSVPLASVYSGHQFGQWAGQLGDGRAILLGETTGRDGSGLEMQLKGAGRTPYSRTGDGRAVLRSSIREFLGSEAMHGLGIPTSRALCVAGSDAHVRREEIETAAVVTRIAPSFIRFGHFEHFSYGDHIDELRALADYVIERYYPKAIENTGHHAIKKAAFSSNPHANRYAALLQLVSEKTALMVAHWQSVGFCHGVMNTDNMSILGLTIDYGPFQFMDAYVPGHVCNHSDTSGRYAFNKQPNIAYWNLYALGQALLPLIGEQEHAVAALESFKTVFPIELERLMWAKLGLMAGTTHGARARVVIESILKLLAQEKVDFTIFWRRLSRHMAGDAQSPMHDLFLDRDAFGTWLLSYKELEKQSKYRHSADLMLKTNPKYVLRNHLGEEAIRQAKLKDFTGVQDLLTVLESPFDEHSEFEAFASFPPDWAAAIEISCSS